MFISEECPTQIGSKAEDHLRKKVYLHSNEMKVDKQPSRLGSKGHLCGLNEICIPQIRWKCPPVFTLKSDLYVATGEQSEEKEIQNDREMRVMEVLYPCVSVIPSSPRISPELEVCDYDDNQTPIIPTTPIEEEDSIPAESTPCSKSVESIAPSDSNATANETFPKILAGLHVYGRAAASAVLTAMWKINEKGSLIDIDLLIKILNEPAMLEALSKVPGSSTSKKPTLIEPENKQNPEPLPSQTIQGTLTSRPSAKPSTFLPSNWANENAKPFSTYRKTYSNNSSISVLGNSVDYEMDLSRKVFNMINSSSSDMFSRSLQNSRILDQQSFRPPLVSSTRSEDKKLPQETHMFQGYLPSQTIQGPTTSWRHTKASTSSSMLDNETAKGYFTNLTPYSDTCSISVSRKPADSKIVPASSSSIFVSNAPKSDLFVRPDIISLQNHRSLTRNLLNLHWYLQGGGKHSC